MIISIENVQKEIFGDMNETIMPVSLYNYK